MEQLHDFSFSDIMTAACLSAAQLSDRPHKLGMSCSILNEYSNIVFSPKEAVTGLINNILSFFSLC